MSRVDLQSDVPPDGLPLYAGAGGLFVTGSGHYREAISRLVPRMSSDGVSMTAALFHQPDNAHDPNAVGVYVYGQLIGHLAREDAQKYAPVLDALAQRGLYGYCRVDIQPARNPEYVYDVRAYVDTPSRQFSLIASWDASRQ